LQADPNRSFFFEAAAFSGDVGDAATNNKHGLRFSFHGDDGVLIFAEGGYTVNPTSFGSSGSPQNTVGQDKLSGTYKLGGCFDTGEFRALENNFNAHHHNYAIYFLADQELWHLDGNLDRTLALFCRVGFAPQDRNPVTAFVDSGLTMQGLLASRSNDLLGLGFSYGQLSDFLEDESGRKVSNHNETVLELTYRIALNSHASLQPDLQGIFNPGGLHSAPTAFVAGLRCTLSY
jgi:porin